MRGINPFSHTDLLASRINNVIGLLVSDLILFLAVCKTTGLASSTAYDCQVNNAVNWRNCLSLV